MARLFDDASSHHLVRTAAVVAALPATLGCWFWADDGANIGTLVSLDNSGANTRVSLVFRGDAGDTLFANSEVSGSDQAAVSSAGVTLNAWQHGLAAFDTTTSRAVWLNGGSKGTSTASSSPSGLNRTSVGRTSRSAVGQYFSGRVAEAAAWAAALSDAEALILALGFEPSFVRPTALADHWPLVGRYSPEVGRRGNELTVTGATAADHPRIIRRASVHVAMQAAVAWTIDLGETLTLTDTLAKSIGLAIAQLVSVADARTIEIGLGLGDTLGLTDTRTLGAGKALGDSILLTDARAMNAGKACSEALALSDARVMHAGKAVIESLDLIDTRALTMTLRLAQSLGLSDAAIAALAGILLLSRRAASGDPAIRTGSGDDSTSLPGGIG